MKTKYMCQKVKADNTVSVATYLRNYERLIFLGGSGDSDGDI